MEFVCVCVIVAAMIKNVKASVLSASYAASENIFPPLWHT